MNVNDIKVLKHPGPTRLYDVDDRTTSSDTVIYPGEPVKVAGAGTNFVQHLATGDPEIGTDEFVGIARKESTETSSADGDVEVTTLVPGLTILRAKATTVANLNTAAKLLGLKGDYVCFDLTSTTFTIDEDEGTDPNVHGLKIIDGDIVKGTLDVLVSILATEHGVLTGQAMD